MKNTDAKSVIVYHLPEQHIIIHNSKSKKLHITCFLCVTFIKYKIFIKVLQKKRKKGEAAGGRNAAAASKKTGG
ncbi:MAG: hypothetical protein K2F65_02010, partial [Eubacterium sp.]|nr:hypothetical protein [Eubacterium sp.]